jgi:formylglycine-generating enzyme required for sulfatase activity
VAENAGGDTHDVAQKPANAFGLHDVHGNVWEWVLDGYYTPYDAGEDFLDEQGQPFRAPETSRSRITRGGGFATPLAATRSSNRGPINPEAREGAIGVRPARSIRD